ncbi:extracellular solute-binding protein [Paenibacillus koleovorans]|uniref:extracellular solute-binding protein n=1 Tax=Paenibacillus koleovorans TaxID=121608 RepID=UPI000FDB9428|nr:extracellular solute-binding protein [Paenibacillus koleovorans]
MINKKFKLKAVGALAMTGIFALTACSSGGTSSSSSSPSPSGSSSPTASATPVKTPITFTMNTTVPTMNWDNDIAKEITKRTGGTIKWDVLTGDERQKMNVWLAAGDYPDVVTMWDDTYKAYADAKALVDLTDLIPKHAPNIMKAFNNDLSSLKQPDGKIWALRGPTTTKVENLADKGWVHIQAAVLKEFNYPQIKTLEDVHKLVSDYIKKYPEIGGGKTIGFSNYGATNQLYNIFDTAARLYAGMPATAHVYIPDNEKPVLRAFGPGYTDVFKFFNQMNVAGLFDQESLVQTPEQFTAKCAQGRVLVVFAGGGCTTNLVNAKMEDRSYISFDIVAPGRTKVVPTPSAATLRGADQWLGITKNAKDPVRILQFYDEMYKLENQILVGWGIEGKYYTIENGKRVVTDYVVTEIQKGGDAWDRLGFSYPRPLMQMMQSGAYLSDGDFAKYSFSVSWNQKTMNATVRDTLAKYNAKTFVDMMVKPVQKDLPFSTTYYNDDMKKFTTDAIAEWSKVVPKMILESESKMEANWAALEKTLKDKGMDKFNADAEAAYKKQKAEVK